MPAGKVTLTRAVDVDLRATAALLARRLDRAALRRGSSDTASASGTDRVSARSGPRPCSAGTHALTAFGAGAARRRCTGRRSCSGTSRLVPNAASLSESRTTCPGPRRAADRRAGHRAAPPKKSAKMSPNWLKMSWMSAEALALALQAGMTEAIVGGALLGVAQHRVGLGGLLELLFGGASPGLRSGCSSSASLR